MAMGVIAALETCLLVEIYPIIQDMTHSSRSMTGRQGERLVLVATSENLADTGNAKLPSGEQFSTFPTHSASRRGLIVRSGGFHPRPFNPPQAEDPENRFLDQIVRAGRARGDAHPHRPLT